MAARPQRRWTGKDRLARAQTEIYSCGSAQLLLHPAKYHWPGHDRLRPLLTSPHQGLLWWGAGAEGARLEEDTHMTKHTDGPIASGVENDVLADQSV